DFWASYVLTASPETVAAEIAKETRVYMTHVNTPNEVVIGGDVAACERIVARLNVTSVRAPVEVVIHNDAMMSEYAAFYALHHRPAYNETPDVKYYSAADYEPIALNSDLIARSIARVTCKPVDFPRLIQKAYQDGTRVFVELGPGSTCTRWIDDTLGAEHVHLAAAVDNLRLDDHPALVKLLGRLMSPRMAMDRSPLYAESAAMPMQLRLRSITLGGASSRDVILSEENRRRFGQGTATGVQLPAANVGRTAELAGVGAAERTVGLRQM